MIHKRLLWCIPLVGTLLLSGCGTASAPESADTAGTASTVERNEKIIQEIQERGYLLVGCKTDVPGLSLYEETTDTWLGLETDLAYEIAGNIFDVSAEEAREQERVQFLGVTVADREQVLEQDVVDCLLATYTITEERKQKFALSDSYYTSYIGLMVKDSGTDSNALGSSDIQSIADLDGKYIGVPRNATTRADFLNYLHLMNTIQVTPVFCEYEGYDILYRALKNGNIDAIAVDVSILNGYDDNTTKILKDRFAAQHYGAAVKQENADLIPLINAAIAE